MKKLHPFQALENSSFQKSKNPDILVFTPKNYEFLKKKEYFPAIYSKNPVNLLFSTDQFLSEFFLKYPQRTKYSEYKLQLKHQKKLRRLANPERS